MGIKDSQSSWIVLFTKHGPINRHPYFAIFYEVSVYSQMTVKGQPISTCFEELGLV